MNSADHAKLKHKYSVETGEHYPLCTSTLNLSKTTDWVELNILDICECGAEQFIDAVNVNEFDNKKINATLRYINWLEETLINTIKP